MSAIREWLDGVVAAAKEVAMTFDSAGAEPHWEDDGSLELFLVSRGQDLHGRIAMAKEDDGEVTAFWSLGWQGCGGGQMDMAPTAEAAAEVSHMVFDVLRAERLRDQQKGLVS